MLDIDLCGLRLTNPLILASGVLGVSSSLLQRAALEGGFGAVTSKSIGPSPRAGNLNPSVIELDNGVFLNAVGLANPGIDAFMKEIPGSKVPGVPLVVSIFGDHESEYPVMARKVEHAGADAVELNISCPHATVSSIGADASLTRDVVARVRDSVSIPLLVKLNPNVTDLVSIALAAQEAGADAVVAINTVRGMAIDVDVMRPVLANKSGGVSGKALKPIAIRSVYELHRALDIPIIGSGGVFTGRDVIEFILAGASAVQIGSALVHGLGVVKEIKDELVAYMRQHAVARLSDLVGKAHDR